MQPKPEQRIDRKMLRHQSRSPRSQPEPSALPSAIVLFFPQQVGDFGNGEEAEADDHQRNAVVKVLGAEDHAELARCRRSADRPDQQADRGGSQSLGQAATGENGYHRQAEEREHEQLSRSEEKDQGPGDQHEEGQDDRADDTAEE